MLESSLNTSTHYQQAVMGQPDIESGISLMFPAKPQGTFTSKTDGGDQGVRTEFGLIIAVPPHALLASRIAVEQDTIEVGVDARATEPFNHRITDVHDNRMPVLGREVLP